MLKFSGTQYHTIATYFAAYQIKVVESRLICNFKYWERYILSRRLNYRTGCCKHESSLVLRSAEPACNITGCEEVVPQIEAISSKRNGSSSRITRRSQMKVLIAVRRTRSWSLDTKGHHFGDIKTLAKNHDRHKFAKVRKARNFSVLHREGMNQQDVFYVFPISRTSIASIYKRSSIYHHFSVT